MKKYFNMYNIITYLALFFISTLAVERLSSFLMNVMSLTEVLPVILFVWSLRFLMLLLLIFVFVVIYMEIYFRASTDVNFKNSLKSYKATWLIRRFCTQINTEPTLEESNSYRNTKQIIVKKANRSVLTLVVTYFENKAIATWYLPPNSESFALMEELLPKVKQELNLLDNKYLFNDFIRVSNSRCYKSEAILKKIGGAVAAAKGKQANQHPFVNTIPTSNPCEKGGI